jgi:uncharacterized phiE125 gp8 family phage protein
MHLTELTPIPAASLPVAAFRDHLRQSSGFADAVSEDDLLEQYLRAAIAQVEGRTGRALLARDFALRLTRWRDGYAQPLTIAPVSAVTSVTLVDVGGVETLLPPESYLLQADSARPRLVAAGTALPMIPMGGSVVIVLTAGFGPAWDDIPADLRQAVLLLAAQYYEGRDTGGSADMDFGVRALLERWRDIRLGGRT